MPRLRVKIESLTRRFQHAREPEHHGNVKEISPTALPRTTKEMDAFLLFSPQDFVTLVRTLYPTAFKSSSNSSRAVDIPRSRGAAPMGASSPGPQPSSSPNSLESAHSPMTASMFTVRSDETGNESLITNHLDQALAGASSTQRASMYPHHDNRDSLPARLFQAADCLSNLLQEKFGTYHPSALDDLWTVLHISKHGTKLSTRIKGYNTAEQESDEASESDLEDDDSPVNFLPHRKYHRLKRTVTELVKAYEITPIDGDRTPPEEYSSNLTLLMQSNFQLEAMSQRSKGSHMSLNPYQRHAVPTTSATGKSNHRPVNARQTSLKNSQDGSQPIDSLLQMLGFAKQQCMARGDFGLAHRYNDGIEQLQALPPSLKRDNFSPLLTVFVRGCKEASIGAHNSMEEHEAYFFWLEQSQQQQQAVLDRISQVINSLRLKLWYDTEVRNSEPYATVKHLAIAMRTMGQWLTSDSTNPAWGSSEKAFRATMDRMSVIERQVFQLMAAPTEEGGPTKLANDQVEMVRKWLHQQDIWNACPAEERLHRFCLAIIKFQYGIIGDRRSDWAYLRSSETYHQEISQIEREHSNEDQDRGIHPEHLSGSRETSSLRGKDKGSEDWFTLTSIGQSGPGDLRIARGAPAAPTNATHKTAAVLEKSKHRPSPTLNRQTTTSTSASSSSSSQPEDQQHRKPRKVGSQIEPAPPTFIRELSEGLISLVLSELGPIAFESGSETDSWLTSQYSEECFTRLLERQKRDQEQLHEQKSMNLLHKAYLSKAREGVTGRPKQTDRQAPLDHAAPKYRPDPRLESFGRRSSSPVPASSHPTRMGWSARRSALFDFPYNLAFTRLFEKFAVHPSPFVKLETLYDIHQLIIARLKAQSTRSDLDSDSDTQGRHSQKGSSRGSDVVHRHRAKRSSRSGAKSHRGSVHSEQLGSTDPHSNEDAYSEYTGSEDDVHSSLYDLLKSSEMRPSTFYRDLQYIASVVPRYILDKSVRGDTFWIFAKVALMLKNDICLVMVEIASELLTFYMERQRADLTASSMSETASVAESVSAISLAASDLASHYSIIDVANMWVIAAMEGNRLGQRELALMFIRYPEVVPTVTPPLTRAGDTITPSILADRRINANRNRSANESGDDGMEGKTKSHKKDPVPMALATAWMKLAAEGGDADARSYVRQRKEGFNGDI